MLRVKYKMTNELDMVPGKRNFIVPLEEFEDSEAELDKSEVRTVLAEHLNENPTDIEILNYERI